jgi:hypothetical protein
MTYTQAQVTAIVEREVARALEMAAQELYARAELASTASDSAITRSVTEMFTTKERTYCGAAEIVRRTTDVELVDNPYVYEGELNAVEETDDY